jgi:hypothetical protein
MSEFDTIFGDLGKTKRPNGSDHGDYAGLAEQLAASAWLVRDVPSPEQLLGELITTATRCLIVGRTGLGKTLLGLAMAMGMAFGIGFLHCDRADLCACSTSTARCRSTC